MARSTFVGEVAGKSARERMHAAVRLGQRAAGGDRDARATVDELGASPEAYERLLGLATVHGTRDEARILAAIEDPSRTVRRYAARLLGTYGDGDLVKRALPRIVDARLRRRTVATLVRRKRVASVDAFLAEALAQPTPALVDLVPFGSDAAVAARLDLLAAQGAWVTWGRTAERHAALVARWFRERLERDGFLDERDRHRLGPLFATLGRRAPDETLALVAALFVRSEAPSFVARALHETLRRRPRETFDLLRQRFESGGPTHPPGAFGVVRFDRVAHRLGAERLGYLVRHAEHALGDRKAGVRWFLRLPDDDRRAVLGAFVVGRHGGWGSFLFRYLASETAEDRALRERAFTRWRDAAEDTRGCVAIDALRYLPVDLRHAEARRHLHDVPAIRNERDQRLPYAELLPFAEAQTELAAFLGHPEGEVRSAAQRILIATLDLDRTATAAVLANVRARAFEQDPVRRAMLEALAKVPIARFGKTNLEDVSAIAQAALDAADLSAATASALETWVARLFRVDGDWGAAWLTKLLTTRGSVSTWALGQGLTKADAERLAPAFAGLVAAWSTAERAYPLYALAVSLGLRLRQATPLLDALETMVRGQPFVNVAGGALELLAKHDRPRFARLVPELVALDRSFVLLAKVAAYVSARRQDLLDPFLEAKPMTGRFATGRTHWVIDFQRGHGRWTATQQRRYAAGLQALLDERERDVPTLRFAIQTLARLAFADAAKILPYASDPRPPLREMAIRALPWLDEKQGAATLIEALGDDRARWAIYALRKLFAESAREEVLARLRAAPTKRVTVAKEVVRLLGELGGDDAFEELARMDQPGLHRDVRIALLRAMFDHLENPTAWSVLERAVDDPDWVLAGKIAELPLARLSGEAERRVTALLARVLGRKEPEARMDLLRRAMYLPLGDASRELFRRLVEHMGVDDEAEADAAFATVVARMRPNEARAVGDRLIALQPRRRHLARFVPTLIARLGPYAPPMNRAVAEAFLTSLRADATATPLMIGLAAKHLEAKAFAEVLLDLSARDWLYADASQAAIEALRTIVAPETVEAALAGHADPRVRRLGLAALCSAASPKNGWSEARRERLRTFREDPSPWVAGPARMVFPPRRTEEGNP